MEPAGFMADQREDLPVASMDLRHRTAILALTQARSAALITAE